MFFQRCGKAMVGVVREEAITSGSATPQSPHQGSVDQYSISLSPKVDTVLRSWARPQLSY